MQIYNDTRNLKSLILPIFTYCLKYTVIHRINKYDYKIKFSCSKKKMFSLTLIFIFYVPDQFELSKFSVSQIVDNSIFCLFRTDSNY